VAFAGGGGAAFARGREAIAGGGWVVAFAGGRWVAVFVGSRGDGIRRRWKGSIFQEVEGWHLQEVEGWHSKE